MALALFILTNKVGAADSREGENNRSLSLLSYSIGWPAFDKLNRALFDLIADEASFPVTFESLPIVRYHLNLPVQKNTCSFNMTRTPENEPKYTWLVPTSVFFLKRYVVSEITAEQRDEPILVLKGSDIHKNMLRAGFNVEGVRSRELIVRMIEGGRAFSWIDSTFFVENAMTDHPNLKLITDGVVYKGQTWLVCSRKTETEIVSTLKAIWEKAMRDDVLRPWYGEEAYGELLKISQSAVQRPLASHKNQF